jgi:hypothetical protein
MTPDEEEFLRKFYRATNPERALFSNNLEKDKKYYIDFSSVRGGQIIEALKRKIVFFSPDEPTCQLFTGHVGCGKSTELLRLKAELKEEGFELVYFESTEDLEKTDVDISDILLAIARRVDEKLKPIKLAPPEQLRKLVQQVIDRLTRFDLSAEAEFPGIKASGTTEDKGKFSLSLGIAKITVKAKNSSDIRRNIREYLEPRTVNILDAINQELLEPGIKKLKEEGKKGLVVIVDNLDRIDNTPKPWNRTQQEYLFVDRGAQLRSLKCHVIYTMPLALRFSNEYGSLTQRFQDPKVLPMVPVKLRDGNDCSEGMSILREMVMARALPELDREQQLSKITEIFDSPDTLDRLCRISGGHVRNLLRILNNSIQKQGKLPIFSQTLEDEILEYRSERLLAIEPKEWDLLRYVSQHKKVTGDDGYKVLIRSLFVYEYTDRQGKWFDINPILADAEELK